MPINGIMQNVGYPQDGHIAVASIVTAFSRRTVAKFICEFAQPFDIPVHSILSRIAEHLEEESGDEFSEVVVGLGAKALDARRSVQDIGDTALFVEGREGDWKRFEVLLPNRCEGAALSFGDKFRFAVLDNPVHEITEGNSFIWSNGRQASTDTASLSRDIGRTGTGCRSETDQFQ